MLKVIGFIVLWMVVFIAMELLEIKNHAAYAFVGGVFGVIYCSRL